MKFSKKILSQTVTQLCLVKEIDHVVISPGSRNAPLTIGFTEHPDFKCFSIVDERCAAFFALGMAQQLKKPVALVCTSGSALLNYYPAIAEAFYSDIPLVILSADRPANLIDVGDGQTIRQENVFANHILYSANCEEGQDFQVHNETEINVALNLAIEFSGPVHINLPFSEPLYAKVEKMDVRPQHVPIEIEASEALDIADFSKIWSNSSKKMVLVGSLSPMMVDKSLLNALANDESTVILTETTSNFHHENFISAIDQLIAPLTDSELEELRPEVLLTFGGMVVSKKIKAFLRKYPAKYHYHVDSKKAFDTYFSMTAHFKVAVNLFLNNLNANYSHVQSFYRNRWLDIRDHRRAKHASYLKNVGFSDFKVYSIILNGLANFQLQLANSTAIRYAQLFQLAPSLEVYCNRGASGIDGSTSTSIGAALISKLPTIFMTGDLSFFYDSNALWNHYIPKNYKIVLLNNDGGGIFKILPDAQNSSHFETYFETKHGLDASHLCAMFGFNYVKVTSEEELKKEWGSFSAQSNKPSLMEIQTSSAENDVVLKEYFRYVK